MRLNYILTYAIKNLAIQGVNALKKFKNYKLNYAVFFNWMIGSRVNAIFMNMIQWPRTYDLLINSVGNM